MNDASGPRVLVVEDETDVLDMLRMFLEEEGYVVTATTRAAAAADLARDQPPDLVICDIAMPDFDGYDVLEAFEADPNTAACPIMFLTGRQQFSERMKAFRAGVDDYMTKPFTRKLLLLKVQALLAKRGVAPPKPGR